MTNEDRKKNIADVKATLPTQKGDLIEKGAQDAKKAELEYARKANSSRPKLDLSKTGPSSPGGPSDGGEHSSGRGGKQKPPDLSPG
jgi:hypothetical protein